MKFKTTIPDEPLLGVTAVSGATKTPGKTNDAEANLLGHDPGSRPASAVKDAEEVKGCARRCIDEQLRSDEVDGTTSSPKKRDSNSWGTGFADSQNKKTLTK
jgi:hypothetical protein